jgi:hypothetical protein
MFGGAGELDEHRQGDEVLLAAVMQVTFEAAPFLVSSGDQPGTRRPQRRGVFPHNHQEVKGKEHQCRDEERALDSERRMRTQV